MFRHGAVTRKEILYKAILFLLQQYALLASRALFGCTRDLPREKRKKNNNGGKQPVVPVCTVCEELASQVVLDVPSYVSSMNCLKIY